jgi:hypothetical protein
MLSPLPRWDRRWDRFAPRIPTTAAFPMSVPGRLPHQTFRGLLSVHCALRPACSRDGLPALSIEGSGDVVTSSAASIATGWSESCRVGLAPTEDRRLGTAHTDTGFPAMSHRAGGWGRRGVAQAKGPAFGTPYSPNQATASRSVHRPLAAPPSPLRPACRPARATPRLSPVRTCRCSRPNRRA